MSVDPPHSRKVGLRIGKAAAGIMQETSLSFKPLIMKVCVCHSGHSDQRRSECIETEVVLIVFVIIIAAM